MRGLVLGPHVSMTCWVKLGSYLCVVEAMVAVYYDVSVDNGLLGLLECTLLVSCFGGMLWYREMMED
jgi:hypothetical protein